MSTDLSSAIARAIAALEQLAPAHRRTATIQSLYETQRRLAAAGGSIALDLADVLRAAIEDVDDDAPAEACDLRRSLAEATQEHLA